MTFRRVARHHRRLPDREGAAAGRPARRAGPAAGAAPAELGALATARERVADRRPSPPAGPPRQLPAPPPGFTGQAAALAALDAPGAPVVLSGPAGAGKTALAVHWAHRAADVFPDGQLWADLNGSSARPAEPGRMLDRLLVALGGSAGGGEVAYRTLLARRRIVVVLDDAADAAQVRPLLPGGPGCRAVITSRSRLSALVAIDGARPWQLGPMDRGEARRLLAARLGPDRMAADPDGAAAICAASAGLPLALVVAAARVLTRPGISLLTVARELATGDLPVDGDWDRVTEIGPPPPAG